MVKIVQILTQMLNSIICDIVHIPQRPDQFEGSSGLAGRSGGKQSNGQALSISCSKVMVMMMSLPPWFLFASISLSLIIVRSALHGRQVDPTLICFVSRGRIA